jgi:hypothetical protein
MANGMEWQRPKAESHIRDLFDAAKVRGTQKVVDSDGTFEVSFVPRMGTLEELFSGPGTIGDE